MKNFSPMTRRQLLVRAGATLGASLLLPGVACSNDEQTENGRQPTNTTFVFTHTTVVTGDANRAALKDVALAVKDGIIAAIGPTDELLQEFPDAEVIDGRNKALLPGIINCHAHLSAAIARGFNEDFGFPNRQD